LGSGGVEDDLTRGVRAANGGGPDFRGGWNLIEPVRHKVGGVGTTAWEKGVELCITHCGRATSAVIEAGTLDVRDLS
jgi:hypothetical protein